MRTALADVADGEDEVFGELLLHLKVPILDHGWTALAWLDVVSGDRLAVFLPRIKVGRWSEGWEACI